MRDHCMVRPTEAILPSPNRARFWTMEFHFIPNAIDEDFEGLNEFLVRWAAPDLARRSIDLKLHFVDILREQIESGYVRHAIYSLQAVRKVASVELYLTEILWDFRNLGKPKDLIARWEGSDDKIYEQPVLMNHWLVPFYLEHDIQIEAEKLRMTLLLVNHQFRDEFTEWCEDQQALYLHDACKSLDDAIILAEFDILRSWALTICYFESAREPTTLLQLEGYLGDCTRWFKDLPAVNVRLYTSHRQDFDDYTPSVFDRLESNIVKIASFLKVAEVDIHAIKRTWRRTSITWSRKLLARWCRSDCPSDIFLDRAPHGGKIEWEVHTKSSLDDDDSASFYHSSDSWLEDWGDDSKDHSSEWGDDGGNNNFSNLEPYYGRRKDSDKDSEVWPVSRGTDDSTDDCAEEEDVEGNTGTRDSRSDRNSGSDAIKRVRQWLLLGV